MPNNQESLGNAGRSEGEYHDRFVELCALFTSGELSEAEQKDLRAHLTACADCRQALEEFEAVAAVGIPLIHPMLGSRDTAKAQPVLLKGKGDASTSFSGELRTPEEECRPVETLSGPLLGLQGNRGRLHVNWDYVWIPFAAAVALTAALSIYTYQVGKRHALEAARVTSNAFDTKLESYEQQISDLGHEREVMKAQLTDRDRLVEDLKRQMAAQSAELSEARSVQANLQLSLQETLQSEAAGKQKLAQQQSAMAQQLSADQASLAKTQTELSSLQKRSTEDQLRSQSLEAQILDLHGQLREREQALDREEELLAHDRDIRELIGARELYIAEVYDVAKDGQTKKPYGRVFYTRGKSLVFYAYDLDQQPGARKTRTFQAWGSRGVDRSQATSLGVFYEDSAAKKRWVLKSDDPKKLEQIDAVFVTVEPNGGSLKPSGKPLLFAYLKVEPNHP